MTLKFLTVILLKKTLLKKTSKITHLIQILSVKKK